LKILIADDSEAVRQRLSEMLSEIAGVQVVGEACDMVDALELFEKSGPDAVILDIRMPRGGGIEALRRIKGKCPRTRVLILTNYPCSQYRNKCLQEGADYFFDKSNEFMDVVGVIEGLLSASG